MGVVEIARSFEAPQKKGKPPPTPEGQLEQVSDPLKIVARYLALLNAGASREEGLGTGVLVSHA